MSGNNDVGLLTVKDGTILKLFKLQNEAIWKCNKENNYPMYSQRKKQTPLIILNAKKQNTTLKWGVVVVIYFCIKTKGNNPDHGYVTVFKMLFLMPVYS
eukprot:14570814-Ditylum_brightwellii.AAC.1